MMNLNTEGEMSLNIVQTAALNKAMSLLNLTF